MSDDKVRDRRVYGATVLLGGKIEAVKRGAQGFPVLVVRTRHQGLVEVEAWAEGPTSASLLVSDAPPEQGPEATVEVPRVVESRVTVATGAVPIYSSPASPPLALRPGEWQCPGCGGIRSGSIVVCRRCGTHYVKTPSEVE